MGLVSNFLSIRVAPGSSRMFNKFFTLLRRLVFFLSSSSPHTAHPTSSKFSGFIRVHASLMIACSRCLLAGSGGKEILISGVWFLSEALRAFAFSTHLIVRATCFLAGFFSTENTVMSPVHLEQLCSPMLDLSDVALLREPTAMPYN